MNERRRMPMKKGSFIRNLSIMLFAQLILLTVLFVVLVANMRDTATAEMETAADNMLSIYSVNLENRIERADNILKNLTLSEETSLELIRSDSESDRYYAKKTIYTAMHSALVQDIVPHFQPTGPHHLHRSIMYPAIPIPFALFVSLFLICQYLYQNCILIRP